MVTELVGVDHIRPAFGFLTMILGVGVTIGTPIGGMYRRTMNLGWDLNEPRHVISNNVVF